MSARRRKAIGESPWFKINAVEATWSSLDIIYLLRRRNARYGTGEIAIREALGLTSVGSAIEWIEIFGDPKEKIEWVMWKRMIGSEIVTTLPEHLDPEAYAKARNLRIQKTLKEKPHRPWRRYPATKVQYAKDRWFLLDELYDWIQDMGNDTDRYGNLLCRSKVSAANAMGFRSYSCFKSMIEWIEKNGNPRDCEDFLEFQNEYKLNNKSDDDKLGERNGK